MTRSVEQDVEEVPDGEDNFVAVGDYGEGRPGPGPVGGPPASGDPIAGTRRGAPVRLSVPGLEAVTQRVRDARASRRAKMTAAERAAPDVARRSLWRDGLSSPADMIAYVKSGAMLPGDEAPWLERAFKAYGYGIAVPMTIWHTYTGAVWQRFSRLVLVLTICTVLWLTWR